MTSPRRRPRRAAALPVPDLRTREWADLGRRSARPVGGLDGSGNKLRLELRAQAVLGTELQRAGAEAREAAKQLVEWLVGLPVQAVTLRIDAVTPEDAYLLPEAGGPS